MVGPWVSLQCVIVAYPGHTHLRFVTFYVGSSLHTWLACNSKQCNIVTFYQGKQQTKQCYILRHLLQFRHICVRNNCFLAGKVF